MLSEGIELLGDVLEVGHSILRQQYLEMIDTNGFTIDFQVFLKRNESGNLLFPSIWTLKVGHNLEECFFWEFLERYPFSKRLFFSLTPSLKFPVARMNGEEFQRLVNIVKFDACKFLLPFLDSFTTLSHEENRLYFKSVAQIDAVNVFFTFVASPHNSNYFLPFMEQLVRNKTVRSLHLVSPYLLDYETAGKFLHALVQNDTLPSLEELTCLKFPWSAFDVDGCQKLNHLLMKKNSLLKKVKLWLDREGDFDDDDEDEDGMIEREEALVKRVREVPLMGMGGPEATETAAEGEDNVSMWHVKLAFEQMEFVNPVLNGIEYTRK